MSFDITIAFDEAEYLNPQLYMFANTLKDNIPEDTVLHVVTNRQDDDPVLKYISKNIYSKIYKKEKSDYLKSRCRYMLNCFDIETDKEWIIKMESDFIILKYLEVFEYLTCHRGLDLFIEPENRKIFDDNTAERLWRNMYKSMGIKKPEHKITFRENKEEGLPLYGTGLFGVRTKHLDTINKRWVPLTKICERWIDYNTHPNEQAFTGMALDEGWNTMLYPASYKFNPIGHFRKGEFPSTKLIENCILPDVVILDYHRPEWLMHVAKYNNNIGDIICENSKYIPDNWWKLTNMDFVEK